MRDEPVPYMSESDGEEMVKWKHEEMVRNRHLAGKEVPARIISESAFGDLFASNAERYGLSEREARLAGVEYARLSCEGSRNSMHNATRHSFLVPELPWKRLEVKLKGEDNVGPDKE